MNRGTSTSRTTSRKSLYPRRATRADKSSKAQVFTDAHGKIYGTKARPPKGDWYEAETIKVGQLFNVLHKFLRVADQSPNRHHTRGDYLRYACGVSHGGGQKVRGAVCGETVPC